MSGRRVKLVLSSRQHDSRFSLLMETFELERDLSQIDIRSCRRPRESKREKRKSVLRVIEQMHFACKSLLAQVKSAKRKICEPLVVPAANRHNKKRLSKSFSRAKLLLRWKDKDGISSLFPKSSDNEIFHVNGML